MTVNPTGPIDRFNQDLEAIERGLNHTEHNASCKNVAECIAEQPRLIHKLDQHNKIPEGSLVKIATPIQV